MVGTPPKGERRCLACGYPVVHHFEIGIASGLVSVGVALGGWIVFFVGGILGGLIVISLTSSFAALICALTQKYTCGMCRENAPASVPSAHERNQLLKLRAGYLAGAIGAGVFGAAAVALWVFIVR